MAPEILNCSARRLDSEKQIPWKYGQECELSNPARAIGIEFEKWLGKKYSGSKLHAPRKGFLVPVFINLLSTLCCDDPVVGPTINQDAAFYTLKLAADFVEDTGFGPEHLVILCDYQRMIYEMEEYRRIYPRFQHVLAGMPECCTIDESHGLEAEFVLLPLMVTRHTSPGSLVNPHRLFQATTRHKCGLAIIGDIACTGKLKPMWLKNPDNCVSTYYFKRDGEKMHVNPGPLRKLLVHLKKDGRLIDIDVKNKMGDLRTAAETWKAPLKTVAQEAEAEAEKLDDIEVVGKAAEAEMEKDASEALVEVTDALALDQQRRFMAAARERVRRQFVGSD